jgi:signal transduction histidine kinase/HAMP domain-containing protein
MIPTFALMLDSAGKYRELTAAQVKQNALVAGRAIASEQDRVLENAHEFLVTLSRLPQIREKDRAACRKILAGLLEPRYADLALADPGGHPLCTALSASHSLANSGGLHHSRSVEEYDFAVGNIRRLPASAKALVDVSYPVLDRPGVVRAVVSAAIDLSWINRMAVDTHLHPGASFTLINGKGEALLRYPAGNDWIGKTILPHGAQLATLSSSRENTIEARGPDGIPRLFAFSPLKNPVGGETVYAAVDLPVEIAFYKTRDILMQQLIALGILSALILASTWFGTDALVLRRIRDIIAATQKMAAGNLRARTALAYDTSELGQMARAFDNLAETLEKREAEAVQAARQIHQQRQQQEALYDLNRGITSTLDVASVLTILLDHISLLFPSYAVTVSWIHAQSKVLETIACRTSTGSEPADTACASKESLPELVLQQRSPLAVLDGRADLRTADLDPFRRDGWVSYLGLPLTVKNEILGVLSFYSREKHEFSPDETIFLNALVNEAAIAIHNSQLFEQTRQQAAELEKSNKIKDEFLGVMSHELRTPLNIIMNYSEALRMGTFGDMGPDQARGMDKIRLQAGHLLSLINGILEITKIESGTVSFEARPLDLKDFMAELKSDYMLPMETGVTLVWDNGAQLPIFVTDRIKLKQIVTNLINNAIKFTARGSVTISTAIAAGGERLEIQVADTGPGIPNELISSVFDKFRQIDSATTRNYSGAGLGLYIVKNFVTLLGGTIEVRSKLGEGSTFTVKLPVAPHPAEAAKQKPLPGPADSIPLA